MQNLLRKSFASTHFNFNLLDLVWINTTKVQLNYRCKVMMNQVLHIEVLNLKVNIRRK
ncbi:unnamed protein product [Trifolium pratense]|uniref:Uncharacterized protein n=2 Tax=Trifolium pratense TaxID=57577 RepID=A0ACB0J682_TRIPR|nr:unnamed protein product [Trifolium pratense]CAJ2679535.1 unnamed protein product [Trifolium pratense]